MPSGTRAYLWNFDCEPSKESLIKQTVEDAAEQYKLGRIFHEKLFVLRCCSTSATFAPYFEEILVGHGHNLSHAAVAGVASDV